MPNTYFNRVASVYKEQESAHEAIFSIDGNKNISVEGGSTEDYSDVSPQVASFINYIIQCAKNVLNEGVETSVLVSSVNGELKLTAMDRGFLYAKVGASTNTSNDTVVKVALPGGEALRNINHAR